MPKDHSQKTKKEYKNSKKQRLMKYWSKELDKACFQYDMVYEDFEDLTSRTASEKVLRDKAFNIAKNQKYDGYQRDIASMVYKFFDKETSDSSVKNENMSNK